MSYLYYLKLLFLNFLGIHRLPSSIKYNDVKWDLHLAETKDGWMLIYLRFIETDEGTIDDELIKINDTSLYRAYRKMVSRLWAMSENITII